MVASNDDFVLKFQSVEPINKVFRLFLASIHREISTVYENITLWYNGGEMTVKGVCVGHADQSEMFRFLLWDDLWLWETPSFQEKFKIQLLETYHAHCLDSLRHCICQQCVFVSLVFDPPENEMKRLDFVLEANCNW
jgi:hypothetical protein